MLLQLQRFNISVRYRKGSEQYIADLLSRATPPKTVPNAATQSFDVCCAKLNNINYVEYTSVSSTQADIIQAATDDDSKLQTLKSAVLQGWPDNIDDCYPLIREFWNYREEITIQDGILYKGLRMIIPKSLQNEVLKKIHSSHLGIEACIRKASDSLFWPTMRNDIKNMVASCHTCAELSKSQPPEPLQTPKIQTRPWSKVAVDEFQLNGKKYLLSVDHYSDYFEIDRLYSSTTRTIIKMLQAHFARHGVPDEVLPTITQISSAICPNLEI